MTVGIQGETKLPRRDWLLLPAIGVATIILLAVSTESLAKAFFPTSQSGLERCFTHYDPTGDSRVLPNTSYSEQIAESRYVAEYKFNSCGHRATMECGPKPAGTYRIVLIGSSMAQGLYVPLQMTFAAYLPGELSQLTGRKVEVYNEATGGKYRGGPTPAQDSTRQFNEVMAAEPDLILWVVTPLDIANPAFEDPVPTPEAAAPSAPVSTNFAVRSWNKIFEWVAKGTVGDELRYRWEQTRTSLVMKHLLYGAESPGEYVNSYLRNVDDAGFLRDHPTEKWQRLRQHFEQEATGFEAKAKAAGIPFVAVLAPNRAQVAMVSMGEWPAGYDPYKLDSDLHSIIESNGGICIDILPDFRAIPDPERHYFPVDGHPDADGHAVLSRLLAKELTGGAVPALKAVSQTQIATGQGK